MWLRENERVEKFARTHFESGNETAVKARWSKIFDFFNDSLSAQASHGMFLWTQTNRNWLNFANSRCYLENVESDNVHKTKARKKLSP